MSVAFRRDGDDEHKEPRFELPIPPGPNRVTPRGLRLIAGRVAELEAAAADAGDAPAADGSALATLRRDLRYWRTRLATAEPTAPPADGTAGFATRVTFRLNGATRTIAIVGDDEAEPGAGRIGWSAPLARALGGAEGGEHLDFGGRTDAIEVIAIDPLTDA